MTSQQQEAVIAELMGLTPSPIVELYELDATPCGDPTIIRFHNGVVGSPQPVRQTSPLAPPPKPLTPDAWQESVEAVSFCGQAYFPLPIAVEGFELTVAAAPPRPRLSMMNLDGFMSSWLLKTNDLLGARLTRRRTFLKYLDGQPTAASVELPPDVFLVVQKQMESRTIVVFELGSTLDLDGVRFPRRIVQAEYCSHVYRGGGCNFAEQRVIQAESGTLLTGQQQFKGTWQATITYAALDAVSFPAEDGYSVYIANSPTLGLAPNQPASGWLRVQKYCGEYQVEQAYAFGDVVSLVQPKARWFFLALRAIPVGATPPNPAFWQQDVCSKNLFSCRCRFDPTEARQTSLPFGGFPGLLTLPVLFPT